MKRSKQEIIQRINEVGVAYRKCMGVCNFVRDSNKKDKIDIEARKIPFVVISSSNAGERYDWWDDEVYIEELDINGAKTDRFETFFTDHKPSVDNAIGKIENIRIENNSLLVDVVFGTDERADTIFKKYVDGILNDVSIGYRVNDIIVTSKKDEPDHILVTDFEILELSAVWKGFDPGAKALRKIQTDKSRGKNTNIADIEVLYRELKLKERKQ